MLSKEIVLSLGAIILMGAVPERGLTIESSDSRASNSFELVYYDPMAAPSTVNQFDIDPSSAFSTPMRIDYLRRYGDLLTHRAEIPEPRFLAFDVVSEDSARARSSAIKEKPLPQIRQVVPLRYWRWKLEPDPQTVRDVSWVARELNGEVTWNDTEVPRMFRFNRSVWLRSHFKGPEGKQVLLTIGSIVDEFEIWVNGRFVARHNGFEPLTIDLTGFAEKGIDNTIALRIENKLGDQIGIADNISVQGVSDPYLSDAFVKTSRAQGHEADAILDLELSQVTLAAQDYSIKIQITPWFPEEGHSSAFSRTVKIKSTGDRLSRTSVRFHVSNVDLWDPDAPHLYLVKLTLQDSVGNPIDDLFEVTGFRQIEQRQGRLFLNGQPWFMKSFGEALGFAPGFDFSGDICPPDEWIVRDMLLAKRANANTMRIHPWGFRGKPGEYSDLGWPAWGTPNSATNYQRIAWIADQLGVGLIWGTRLWTLWGTDFQEKYAGTEEWQGRLDPSIRHVRNRTSILIYEGLNEVGLRLSSETEKTNNSLSELYEKFCKRYLELINRIDDSRLVLPDTSWGGLAHRESPDHPYAAQQEGPFHPRPLYTYIKNTLWSDHNYYGWYVNMPHRPMLEQVQVRPFVLMETGAEAMPDWSLYHGLRWEGLWASNGDPTGSFEEERLGRPLRIIEDSEVSISQANQALSIEQTVFSTRFSVADGVNINLIADGLAEGGYHKGITDIYRKAKLGFFAAQMVYQPLITSGVGFDFVLGKGDQLHLQIAADTESWGRAKLLTVEVVDEFNTVVDANHIPVTLANDRRVTLAGDYVPHFPRKGYYTIRYTISEQNP